MDALLRLASMDEYTVHAVLPEGPPCGLDDDELKAIIDRWRGWLLPEHIYRAQLVRDSRSHSLYVARSHNDVWTKLGVSARPEERVPCVGTTLVASWFVGTAALALEQLLHAMLAPWADRQVKEGYLLPAADVTAAVERVLAGIPKLEMPDSYYRMKWDEMTALADPFWQRAYEWGWPPEMSHYQPPQSATVTT